MAKLQENALLWACFRYFQLPFFILGFLGFFFPYVYAFVPVHEANLCICSFYNKLINQNRHYAIMQTDASFAVLQAINVLSFYSVNFIFLFTLLWMVYKIRHINDDTKIKAECATIVLLWLFISIWQYAVFVSDQI